MTYIYYIKNRTLKLSALLVLIFFSQSPLKSQVAHTGMRGLTSLEIAAEMGAGINLFNTLDAVASWIPIPHDNSSETVWGQPYTKPEMITSMADRGFKTLRVPATWFNHFIPDSDFTVDPAWMDRVEDVVNYALAEDMYVILNLHHEDYEDGRTGSWLCTTYEMQDTVSYVMDRLWTQIATRFRDYSDYLVFETMNEPREVGGEKEWAGGTTEHRNVMNVLNKVAVDAIRGTGGNNETRFIMLPQVGANPASALDAWEAPNNDTNLIVSVHGYTPYAFWHSDGSASTWGTAAEIEDLENLMKSLSEHFVDNGIGVVIGEWGISDKDNYDQRVNYYWHYGRVCKEYDLVPVVWMFNFNRTALSWGSPLLEAALLSHYDSTLVIANELTLDKYADTLSIGESVQLHVGFVPDTTTFKEVIWKSMNPNVASVSENGLVTSLAIGQATIKAITLRAENTFRLVVPDTLIYYDFFFEAERFKESSPGIMTEQCSDENGGVNVTYIRDGDWCSYELKIDTAGTYNFIARVATATAGGSIEIKANEETLLECIVDGSKSDGWQDWYTTDTFELEFDEGDYELLLTFKGESPLLFNFNWFEITFSPPTVPDTSHQDTTSFISPDDPGREILVYPNPASEYLYIVSESETAMHREITLVNLTAQVVSREKMEPGQNRLNLDVSGFQSGLYILRVGSRKGWTSYKIRIN